MASRERIEAEEKLEAAIKEFMSFKKDDEGLLIDWLLITAQHTEYDDGDSGTLNTIYVPHTQRMYGTAGLIKWAEFKVEQAFSPEQP